MPRDPGDPSNAELTPVVKNSKGIVVSHSAQDTVFRTIEIGAALHLPEYFDSVRIDISAEGSENKFRVLSNFDSLLADDTAWFPLFFEKPGVKNILITPYSSVIQLPAVSAMIVIAPSLIPLPVNAHTPKLMFTGNSIIKPGETCQLTFVASDEDAGQNVTLSLAESIEGATLTGTSFTWTAPGTFVGVKTIKIKATDNGMPSKDTTIEVAITVTATPHPPTLSIMGKNNIKPGELCSLAISTADEDAGQTVFLSMTGAPDDATLADNVFRWTAPDVASVTYEVTFIATDNGTPPLSNRSVISISVSGGSTVVNTAPVWEIDTIERALSDTGKITLSLSGICKDPQEDLIAYTLLDGTPDGDAILTDEYRFTATTSAIGTHYAIIKATDPAGLANTLVIKISVANIENDVTPPVITLIAPAEVTATSNSASFTIDALCSDPSGVASAAALFAGNEFLAVVADGHYKMTVTGLKIGVENQITISVKDAAPAKNEATKVVTVKYIKPEISPITLSAPLDVTTGVDTLPTFSWSGGNGTVTNDTVKYQVRYGTSADNLTAKSDILTAKSLMLTSATKLVLFTKYYWQVVAWSSMVSDTVKSSVHSFTTFDPTAADVSGPAIIQLSGVKNGERVKVAMGSLAFSITDNSGLDSIWWTLNDAVGSAPSKQGDGSYVFSYSQLPYGANKVKVFARDKSTAKNSGSVEIKFSYDTELTPLILSAPANDATGISTSPAFTWTGGDDADGDSVFYKVKYGTATNALSSDLPAVTAKTASVLPANALDANKSYFWMVLAYSKVNGDTVKSAVRSFTTIGTTPTISSVTIPASVNFGEMLTLSVTASGNPQPTIYTWYHNNTPISGATVATYEKATAGAADTGMYFVKVSNGVSEVSSSLTRLDVKCKVTFNSNSGSAVDPQMVSLGSKTSAPSPSPTRTGFKFLGWFTSEGAATEFGFTTTPITGNITLIAK